MEKNIWLDGMMGLIVGDALGNPVQFMERGLIKERAEGPVTGMEAGGAFCTPAGTWTDDSAMALATLVSINEKKTADPEDIMKKFVEWLEKGKYTPSGYAFDIGNTCASAIENFENGSGILDCGIRGEYANGNGALMRILPACLYYYEKGTGDDEAVEGIHIISGLTHNHIRSRMCCGIYYFMVKSILDGLKSQAEPELIGLLQEGIDNGLKFYGRKTENLYELDHLKRLFYLNEFKNIPESGIRSSGYVVHSIEAAIWSLVTTCSYRDGMLRAVNLGDDADSVAAIAGGLAGLYYGYEGIPREWLSVIKRKDWIEGLCQIKM